MSVKPIQERIAGIGLNELRAILFANWLILFLAFLTMYFAKPDSRSYVGPGILFITALPAFFIKKHWVEMLLLTGMYGAVMFGFFSQWSPPMVVLFFVATGLLTMIFLARPWGGTFFVMMAFIVTIPIAISMMGFVGEEHSVYSQMAVLIGTALMVLINGYAIAKQNKWIRTETIRAKNLVVRMEELYRQFGEVIVHAPGIEEALWEVVDLCIPTLGLEDCVIYMVDPQSELLEQVAAYGPKSRSRGEILSPLRIPLGKGIVGKVAASGKPLLVADTSADTDYLLDDQQRNSELAVPIIFEGAVIGVIDSEHSEKDFFTDDHLTLFKMISILCSNKIAEERLIASKVEHAKAEKELIQVNELENLRNTFLNNLSHDLRTPLSLIRGPLQELVKRDEEEVKKMASVALRNAERLNEMVSGLLDMHKLERGALEPQPVDVDLSLKIKSWFSLFEYRAKRTGIRFELEMDEIGFVNCDMGKIGQIVQNLLSNAFKFTPDGGHIILRVEKLEEVLVFHVEDSGPGIPEAHRQKVFERFYKIDHENHVEGTGLGLAMVWEFAELLKGKVHLGDSLLGGAYFKVIIPYELIRDTAESITPMPFTEQGLPLIVLVEDHPEMNAFVSSLLETKYRVISAFNAEEAWELISSYLPDLIITDLMLPGMSGEMLCKRIKNTPLTDHLPVLALSAKQGVESKVNLYGLGADNYLSKPFNPDELRSVVDGLITQRIRMRQSKITERREGQGMRLIDQSISAHLHNTGFGPRDLEQIVGMNRNRLQQKIKSATGKTPVEYIRSLRLEHAKHLLARGEANVSEAAFRSGFSQAAYFSKAYKAYFGYAPSEEVKTNSSAP